MKIRILAYMPNRPLVAAPQPLLDNQRYQRYPRRACRMAIILESGGVSFFDSIPIYQP